MKVMILFEWFNVKYLNIVMKIWSFVFLMLLFYIVGWDIEVKIRVSILEKFIGECGTVK